MLGRPSRSKDFRPCRVVVTGVGLVSPVGIGTEESWQALLQGQPGIARISLFDACRFPSQIAGEVKNFRPEVFIERKAQRKMARFLQFAIAASEFAMKEARLEAAHSNAERIGVYIGSGIGGLETIEREHLKLQREGAGKVSPSFITASIINLAAAQVSIRFGARGPNLAHATACTTGAHAIGEAFRVIERGEADVMICGGTEAAITPLALAGFCAMHALSTRNDCPEQASRPWDAARDGFVIAEGAGVLVLEEREHAIRRNAPVLAELLGYGKNADAHHAVTPNEDGDGAVRVMQLALSDAGLQPTHIQYINAHATSTRLGDRAEAKAINRVFQGYTSNLVTSSSKSMTGHLLGGSGALEAGITVLALRDQIVPPTINHCFPDQNYKLDFLPDRARRIELRHAMSNSFGFGGSNACLVFGKYSPDDSKRQNASNRVPATPAHSKLTSGRFRR